MNKSARLPHHELTACFHSSIFDSFLYINVLDILEREFTLLVVYYPS